MVSLLCNAAISFFSNSISVLWNNCCAAKLVAATLAALVDLATINYKVSYTITCAVMVNTVLTFVIECSCTLCFQSGFLASQGWSQSN